MKVREARHLRPIEDENARLERMVAGLSLDNQALKELARKKW